MRDVLHEEARLAVLEAVLRVVPKPGECAVGGDRRGVSAGVVDVAVNAYYAAVAEVCGSWCRALFDGERAVRYGEVSGNGDFGWVRRKVFPEVVRSVGEGSGVAIARVSVERVAEEAAGGGTCVGVDESVASVESGDGVGCVPEKFSGVRGGVQVGCMSDAVGSAVRGPNYARNKKWREEKKEKKQRRRAQGRRRGFGAQEKPCVGQASGAVPAWRVGAGPHNAGRADAATIVRVLDGTDDPAVKKELAETWIRRKIEENVKAAARAKADVARMKKDEADGVYDRKREVEIAILDKQLSGELSLVIPRSFKKWAQDAAAVARSISDSSGSRAKSAGSKIKTVASGSVGVNSSVSKNASLTDAATMESVVELMDENLALKREIDALKSATERGKVFAGMRAENERLKRENRKLEEGTKILMEQDIQAYNDFCAPMGYDTDDGW